jgi:flagellar hook-associated protein 1 FlgK
VSGFSSLNVARTALWASQRGLDVTGQNIANVNTEGYSRQRAELQAIGANTVPALYSVSNEVGGGVSADTVTRIRDAFLEGRAQTEHANQANLTAAKDALSQIEQAFREPGDTGIQSMLTDVSSAWDDVANHPENLAARSQLLQRAETLVSGLHATKASLDGQWNQTRENLQVLVADVNAAAGSIAKLNEQIKQATITGEPANDLADKRDLLVMTLAEKVGATTTPGEDGAVNVVVAGTTLVAGGKALTLGLSGTSDPDAVTSDPPSIVTVPAGSKLRVGGTAQGQLATLTTIVPDYRTALDGIAQKLAGSLNAVHVTGYDLTGTPGNPMFDDGTGSGATVVDPTTITASNIRLRIKQPGEVAAAKLSPIDTGGAPSRDGGIADQISGMRLDPAGTEAKYRELVVQLGVQSAVATRNLDIQSVIATQVDASRDSVAGVSIDEEMTNMLQFQHAYSAAGRLVTAIDETLDTLINHTGLVGR